MASSLVGKVFSAPFRMGARAARGGIIGTGRATRATARGLGRGAVGAVNVAGDHPRLLATGAVGAGLTAGLLGHMMQPTVQEAFLGSPTALRDIAGLRAQATFMHGYNPDDRDNPYSAISRGGSVQTTANYLYGRPVQGAWLGNVSGSRVLGGYSLGAGGRDRIRGTGRNLSPTAGGRYRMSAGGSSGREHTTDGSMVFGMYNLRR